MIEITKSKYTGFRERTRENAELADITLALAENFQTAGERLTYRVSSEYLGVSLSDTLETNLALIGDTITGKTVNIAGNGIYTLTKYNWTQEKINLYVYKVLEKKKPKAVRSGGQTGVDLAGLVAAEALGIPATGHWPSNNQMRNIHNKNIYPSDQVIRERLNYYVAELKRSL